MGKKTLIIRADAEPTMGIGHIMRCIALAQEWQETGGDVVFVLSQSSRPIERKITREGFCVVFLDDTPGSISDADRTRTIALQNNSQWIVIDGYQFNEDYQSRIWHEDQKLLVIDDYGHAQNYCADIVLNQNMYASMFFYPHHHPQTRFLLGGKYTLLRKEFLRQKSVVEKTQSDSVNMILITMGGSDPDNVTSIVLDHLLPLIAESPISIVIVVGTMNNFFIEGKKMPDMPEKVRIIHSTDEIPDLIWRADIVITGAGTTAWETAFLGKSMIAIVLSENQKRIASILENSGAAIVINDRENIPNRLLPEVRALIESPRQRKSLAMAAQQLIDGQGSSRVVMQMQNRDLRLRNANIDDSEQLFTWANDPVVRENAFEQNPIDRATHERWFVAKMHSPACNIFIAVDKNDKPVGQIRFDQSGDSAEVDISIESSQRKKGLGIELLSLGIFNLLHNKDINTIRAVVKTENSASKKMFEQAGFFCSGKTQIKGIDVFQFVYQRSPKGLK